VTDKGKDPIEQAAFPVDTGYTISPGLTKREWFAGMALIGLLSMAHSDKLSQDEHARDSVLLADALIEALNNGGDTK